MQGGMSSGVKGGVIGAVTSTAVLLMIGHDLDSVFYFVGVAVLVGAVTMYVIEDLEDRQERRRRRRTS